MRAWPQPIVVSALALTEVVAAIWGKVARGELRADHARLLDRAFVSDVRDGRFVVLAISDEVVSASMGFARDHALRGADALQLASAWAARSADPAVDAMAVFDRRLRHAAGLEGFALLPPA